MNRPKIKKSLVQACFQEAVESLWLAKQRSILALIGIVVGIASVIALITTATIVRSEAINQFKELGTEIVNIRQVKGGEIDPPSLMLTDIEDLPYQVPSIKIVAPWIETQSSFLYKGREIGFGQVLGITHAFKAVNKLTIDTGRFISDLDIRRSFCVIGSALAREIYLMGTQDVVGEKIKVLGRTCEIVGSLNFRETGSELDPNTSIFLPISTAQRIFVRPEVSNITAKMDPEIHYTLVENDITTFFSTRDERLNVSVISAKAIIEQIQKQLQLITLLLSAIGCIALLVGGVGVMNVMLSAISERRKEIGIRRAIGARRLDIQLQFLIESITLSVFGGLIGIVLGLGGVWGLCLYTGWSFELSTTAILLGMGVALAVGTFFGFIPAYQAARIDPITALRQN